MIKRWILYLVTLLGCIIFFAAYQGRVAWLLLVTVVCLPFLSLLLSLLPMLLVRPVMECPAALTAGDEETLDVTIHSPLPLPPCRCHFQVKHSLTGQSLPLTPGDVLPAEHCGQIVCQSAGFYVYDYLNLFRLRLRRLPVREILVRPRKVAVKAPGSLDRFVARSWQPKYGGGFAERHELRLYRPGDGLNQVHWKLSAKTGKLIVREPMVPRHGRVLLTVELSGTPEDMDRKLGQLLWMGEYLLEQGLQYEIQALTGSGPRTLPVRQAEDLSDAIDELLRCRPAEEGITLHSRTAAAWHYHIGGDDDET